MGERIETQVPGNIWKVLVKPGDAVKAGDTLFIMEVMKTEVPHDASVDGTVRFRVDNDRYLNLSGSGVDEARPTPQLPMGRERSRTPAEKGSTRREVWRRNEDRSRRSWQAKEDRKAE